MARKKKPPPMTVAQIVNVLWPQLQSPGEGRRAVVSRIRSWLRDDLKAGKLTNSRGGLSLKGRVFDRNEILLRAREKWSDKLATLPVADSADLDSQIAVASVMDADVVPGDLERCQRRLIEAFDEIEQLRAELRLAAQRIADLKPHAEAYLEFKRRSGRRGNSA